MIMHRVGLAIATANARAEVEGEAHGFGSTMRSPGRTSKRLSQAEKRVHHANSAIEPIVLKVFCQNLVEPVVLGI